MNKLISLIFLLIAMIQNSFSQDYGRIDETTLKCVVNIDGKGTGFFVSKPIPSQKDKIKVYVVTNKHMIGDWSLVDTLIPNPSITIFLYTKDKSNPVTPLKIDILDSSKRYLPTVKVHSNPKIDIAVIDITPQLVSINNLDLTYFDMSYLIPIDNIGKDTYTGIGDQVFAIGYPAGITSKKTNKPIVKSGYIASVLSGDLVIYSDWIDRNKKRLKVSAEGKFFLVDGLIIGGNSGGPIVHAKQTKYRVDEKGQFTYTKEEIPNLIFGIVSFGLTNTGISVIYSCDHIIELLNEFKLN